MPYLHGRCVLLRGRVAVEPRGAAVAGAVARHIKAVLDDGGEACQRAAGSPHDVHVAHVAPLTASLHDCMRSAGASAEWHPCKAREAAAGGGKTASDVGGSPDSRDHFLPLPAGWVAVRRGRSPKVARAAVTALIASAR